MERKSVTVTELPCMDAKRFARQKEQCLSGVDFSRKGSVDTPIVDLVAFINRQPEIFTTSSCSGRVIVVDNVSTDGEVQKQGCKWLYVTHDEAQSLDVKQSLTNACGEAVFKFEPMVMHIQVQSLSLAQRFHAAAVASGFRNSGISIGGKSSTKIIVAVRSTHSLEAPLTTQGQLLVSDEYIQYLVGSANKKMGENLIRIDRFFKNVKSLVETHEKESALEKQPKQRQRPHSSDQQTETACSVTGGDTELCDKNTQETDTDSIEETLSSLLFEET